MAFHEIQFPVSVSRGSSGGPERVTDIVTLRSGYEKRNTIWANSKRSYNAGLGIRDLDDMYKVLEFFEARKGQLHGFRWKDWADYKSVAPGVSISRTDQNIGTGDGLETEFQITKSYSDSEGSYSRTIKKPVSGTVLASVNGSSMTEGLDYTVNTTTGIITFTTAPTSGSSVTCGFEFDVPVRFGISALMINVELFNVGSIPDIDIVEIRV